MAGVMAVGQRLTYQDTVYRVLRVRDGDNMTLEDIHTGKWIERSKLELLHDWESDKLTFGGGKEEELENGRRALRAATRILLTPDEKQLCAQRLVFVRATERSPKNRKRLAELINEACQNPTHWNRTPKPTSVPSVTTVLTWIQRYIDSDRDIRSLLPQTRKRGNRKERYSGDVLDIMDDLIDTAYMVEERPHISNVCSLVNARLARENQQRLPSEQLCNVSPSALSLRIRSRYSPYEIHCARYGLRSANLKFRAAGSGVPTKAPLARAEIDHARMDFFLIDDATGLPLGRPWLTVVIDAHTRYVLGFSLSFEEPSSMSVCAALSNALLPKRFDHIEEKQRPRNTWDAWGTFDMLVVDNGLEFHGQAIEDSAGRLGIAIQFCPRKSPWYKGKIERFFGTINRQLIDPIPGKTFSTLWMKEDYDPKKHAVLSLSSATALINQWIVDVYHQQYHRGLLSSPSIRWSETIDKIDRYLPNCVRDIRAAMGRDVERVLSHKGIEFDSLIYNSSELGALRMTYGDRLSVVVTVNDGDLGSLIVTHPNGISKIVVPALDVAYTNGLTRWQHKVCRRYARIKWEENGKKLDLLAAKERIAALIREQFGSRRPGGRRKAMARFSKGDPSKASDVATSAFVPTKPTDPGTNVTHGGERPSRASEAEFSSEDGAPGQNGDAPTRPTFPSRRRSAHP